MPWKTVNGRFVYFSAPVAHNDPVSVATTVGDEQHEHSPHTTGESGLEPGMFCEYSGNPSTIIGTWRPVDETDVDSIANHIQVAGIKSASVAGVVIADNGGTYAVKEAGLTLAWIIRPTKRLLPLSGIYNKSVQGVNVGKSVILVNQNHFVIASSKDDELELLTEKFNELVGV
jgi:hypothetical protein